MNKTENKKKNRKKPVFLWMHSRKLLNQYFFKNKNYLKLNINFNLLKGFISLFVSFIFQRNFLINFYLTLPKENNIKNFLINFYSLMFASLIKSQFGSAIFIIGDVSYPIYQSLLLSSSYFKKIELWIIYQGTGSIEEKINIKYPSNVKKIFFPFAKDSLSENTILKKASKLNKIEYKNIDTSLNINPKNNNNLAIFVGYNKNYNLYPFYIFNIVKILLSISLIKDLDNFDSVIIFLHPRIKFIRFLNVFILKSRIRYRIFNNKTKNFYKYVISYSPTVNSSINLKLKSNKNVLIDLGINFNKKDIQYKIKTFLKNN